MYSNSLYADMLTQRHLLVAGMSGSGKSVVVRGLVCEACAHSPSEMGLVLIDPKRVELSLYRRLPHCVRYASEPADMLKALKDTLATIDSRYRGMQKAGQVMFPGGHVYVIIDELADLICLDRSVTGLLQRISQIGRAAGVHLVCCTQCPLAKILPTEIKVNFDAVLGLRTRSAQDSRNIIGRKGCEELPLYGQGWYLTPTEETLYNIPFYNPSYVGECVRYWEGQKPGGFLSRLKRRRTA